MGSVIIKGGQYGHFLRRFVHVTSILIPLLYFQYPKIFPHFSSWISAEQLLALILLALMMLESIRLAHGWIIVGQRDYEHTHISGSVWSFSASVLVVLLIHDFALALTIIVAFAIGDPIIGELRRSKLPPVFVWVISLLTITLIWQVSILWFHLPQWLVFIMPIVTVLAEYPRLSWIDDNALMQVVPMLLLLAFLKVGWV